MLPRGDAPSPTPSIASLGSAVALLIFLSISIGHLRIRHLTGANVVMLVLGTATVVVTLAGFLATTLVDSPTSHIGFIGLMVISIAVDAVWRSVRAHRRPVGRAHA